MSTWDLWKHLESLRAEDNALDAALGALRDLEAGLRVPGLERKSGLRFDSLEQQLQLVAASNLSETGKDQCKPVSGKDQCKPGRIDREYAAETISKAVVIRMEHSESIDCVVPPDAAGMSSLPRSNFARVPTSGGAVASSRINISIGGKMALELD
jgi:hypothetical protein